MTKKEKINKKRGEQTRARRKAYFNAKRAYTYKIHKIERSLQNQTPINDNIIDSDIIMEYSYKKTLLKSVKWSLLFILGAGLNEAFFRYPDIMGLTFGGIMVACLDFLKHKWGVKI